MYNRGSEVMSRHTNSPHRDFHPVDVKFDFSTTTQSNTMKFRILVYK